jgi:hypothetical protein
MDEAAMKRATVTLSLPENAEGSHDFPRWPARAAGRCGRWAARMGGLDFHGRQKWD